MSKIMLVNVTHVEESRVAVLEDGVLSAYEIETTNTTSLKGNIHNAVVESVHASLEAAFVRIAPGLNGFLPLDEVNFRLLPSRGNDRKSGKIGQHLHQGQKILAQVVREPFAGKPPSVSTYFSLPGRHLVLMPGVDSSGVSRKIEDSNQREKLRKTLEEIKPPEGFGVIVRTAGLGQTKAELQRDLRYLLRLWESVQRASKATEFPGLVYREADLVIRTIRDHFTPDISEVWIDNPETHAKALEFMRDVMPNRAKTIRLYNGERPLFTKFNLEEQIERIYKRKVPLPSGGEIVIDGTEALTAVDVNSARSRKQGDVEETLLQTNVEAAAEIARQLRLRDLGGLVVLDFIDMAPIRNRKKVEKTMRDAMRADKARCDMTSISKFGLMEIARQRLRGTKMAASYATCPVCDGHGLIKNIETAALAALRKLQARSARSDLGQIKIGLPPEVATWLLNNKREELLRIEQRRHVSIEIEPQPRLLRHDIEFQVRPREKGQEPPAPERTETAALADEAKTAARGRSDGTPSKRSSEKAPEPSKRRSRKRATESETSRSEKRAAEARRSENADEESVRVRILDAEQPEGGADTATPAPAEPETSGARPRKRRRRRRRPRSGASQAADAAVDEGGSHADAPADDSAPRAEPAGGSADADLVVAEVAVPRGVRSDELVPAASGGLSRGKRGSDKSSRRRRR